MTPEEKINYALSLVEGATPGPWEPIEDGTGSGKWLSVIAYDFEYEDGSPHELFRSETVQINRREAGELWEDAPEADTIRANAQQIALSPLIPAALRLALVVYQNSQSMHTYEDYDDGRACRNCGASNCPDANIDETLEVLLALLPETPKDGA